MKRRRSSWERQCNWLAGTRSNKRLLRPEADVPQCFLTECVVDHDDDHVIPFGCLRPLEKELSFLSLSPTLEVFPLLAVFGLESRRTMVASGVALSALLVSTLLAWESRPIISRKRWLKNLENGHGRPFYGSLSLETSLPSETASCPLFSTSLPFGASSSNSSFLISCWSSLSTWLSPRQQLEKLYLVLMESKWSYLCRIDCILV